MKAGMVMKFDKETYRRVMTRRNVIAKTKWTPIKCKSCGSVDIFHHGYTRKGTQRYLCTACKRTFIDNQAPVGMRFSKDVIASALNQFYESASLSKIQKQLELTHGVKPDRMTIYRWITRYSKKAAKELNNIPIKTGSTFVADETVLRTKDKGGSKIWFHDVIDNKTRFLLASHISEGRTTKDAQVLLERAAKRANKVPKTVITDKLASYLDGVELAFGAETRHIRAKKLTAEDGTQVIERFHGTLKDRTKVMRSFLRRGTLKTVIDGWLTHYNFFRPHSTLGKTPAEAAGADAPFKSWADVVKGGKYE